jgi:hypothetical protein
MASYHSGPYCKHCANLNRGLLPVDQLPVDHYLRKTRDPNSAIVCPELLKTKCPECGIYGHTKFYCLNKMTSWRSRGVKTEVSKSNIIVEGRNNMFSNLSNDSDSDNENIYETVRPRSPDYPPPDWE